ncbi:MAG: efflux RND transporter permease subunit [Planctomycetota bacterium]
MVVDDAIVVVEDISSKINQRGLNPVEAAITSMSELTGAVIVDCPICTNDSTTEIRARPLASDIRTSAQAVTSRNPSRATRSSTTVPMHRSIRACSCPTSASTTISAGGRSSIVTDWNTTPASAPITVTPRPRVAGP